MNYFNIDKVKNIIINALNEDIGKGDITTQLLVPTKIKKKAVIVANEEGIICGIDIARIVFKALDSNIKFISLVKDGCKIKKGMVLAKVYGSAAHILSAERVALNFLSFLSGVSTYTNKFVKQIQGYKVKILDTRKTIPGLRILEKYAVKIGGGFNHRFCLDDMVLIKENHLKLLSLTKIKEIVKEMRKCIPKYIKIEIEVRNLKELRQVIKAEPDIIMLDNMNPLQVRKAVKLIRRLSSTYRLPKLEASGNINMKNIKRYASTGIDFISLGTLTKDIKSLDISLEILDN